jgi:CBS domain containing-hemolysin-like protein
LSEDPKQSLLGLIKARIFRKRHSDESAHLTEEIHDLMNEGEAKGLISHEESDMVQGVLDLKQIPAHGIMVPRTEISSGPVDSTLGDAIKLVNDCGHTRIPIYNESLDRIVGILHAKDLLKLMGQDPESTIPPEILREPHFVSHTKSAGEVLKDLKEWQTHLAIVTDDYGGTAGIITLEDIIEEIVGDILDEHDLEPPLLTVIDEETVSVDARLEVEKLEEHFNIRIPEGDFESVGGFVIHLLGKVPRASEKVRFDDLEITVQSADLRKIHKMLIRKLPPQAASDQRESRPYEGH